MDSLHHNLEITVLSAENLKLAGKSVKKDTFVVIKVDPLNSQSTRADYEGGSNPSWNQKLEIGMPMHARFITLEVQCKIGSGNRVVGTANVPVSDFMSCYIPENYLNFLSYRLRDVRGEKNGIVNISLKVKSPAACATPGMRKNLPSYSWQSSPSPQMRPTWGVPVGQKNCLGHGGVVTGVPVWCVSRA
ncbi:BON1-associated protein 2 [Jatropha curcas]|uniref:BON1-associated protein 2 n=1 Tax=Jatropha curcas TaxID=180498 RepID=UPI001894D8B9|nr:BON1-associated protein 2 [Jatropha curcas]